MPSSRPRRAATAPPPSRSRLPVPAAHTAISTSHWPGFAIWAAVLAGVWLHRIVEAIPVLQGPLDLMLAAATAFTVAFGFRRALRQRYSRSAASASPAPDSAGTT